jgi:hypothetical protein
MIRGLLLTAVGLASVLMLSTQSPDIERQQKATFIYNFAQYTEWPRQALAGQQSFNLCVVGDSFLEILEAVVKKDFIEGHPISVKRITTPDEARQCHLIFFEASVAQQTVLDILGSLGASPVLTVGDDPGFIRAGGMIRFLESGNRFRFEIDPIAARRASLKISSRLLRLARIFRSGGTDK